MRWTLSNLWRRSIFMNRAYRTFFLFLLAVLVYLPLSLFAPLWVLAIGPVLWGVPHIFSSMRFLHGFIANSGDSSVLTSPSAPNLKFKSFHFFGFTWIGVTALRWLTDHNYIGSQLPFNWPEVFAVVVTFFGLAVLYRTDAKRLLRGLFLLIPIVTCAWYSPFWTSGVLILLHNWIAFFYWVLATKSKSEKRSAIFAFTLFALIHVLVFAGSFDFLFHWLAPDSFLQWAQMDYATLGQSIAPWSSDYHVWYHCVVLYAFGQSLHYFVWLKAIPDQNHKNQIPASFRISSRILLDDIGKKSAYAMIIIFMASIGVWVITSFPQARSLYFLIAAYHGYMEISALALVGVKSQVKP